MNAPATDKKPKDLTAPFNRYAYALAVITGLYFVCFSSLSDGVSMLGVALIFDPFDQKQPFPQRPLYQRIWLIVHVLAVLALFIYMVFIKK